MKRFTSRLRPLTALLTALCLLTAYLPTADASNVNDSLVVGIQSTKTQLIRPLEPLERDMLSIYNLVYESLIVIDDNYMPQPHLCESWEESGNGKTWTFRIRPDLKFSDGSELNAHDIVATAQHILNRANDESASTRGYYGNLRYFVSSISASNDLTVVVKTTSKRTYWGVLYALTFPVLPAEYVAADNPPGSGPYMISTFMPTDYIWLEANPNWWQNQPQVRQIMVTCHEKPADVIESYEYARVDTVFTRSIAAAQHKSGTTSLALDYRTNQLETLLMNHSYGHLSSINVRKAIRCVVDPDKIANTVYMGMVHRTDTPMIAGTWMYNDSIVISHDIQTARDLLAADGWYDSNENGILDRLDGDGELVELTLTLIVYEEPDNDVRVETANMIADALATIGIGCTVSTKTFTDVQAALKAGSFQLALASYALDVCPDPGYLFISGNDGNFCRYRSSAMDDLCDKLRDQTSQAGFQDVLRQIQAQYVEDCPFICLFYRAGSVLTRRMYTTVRDVRELELLRGIAAFSP